MSTTQAPTTQTKTLHATIYNAILKNSNYSNDLKASILTILDTLLQAPPKEYQQLFDAISTYMKEVPGAYADSDLVYAYEVVAQWNMRDIQEKEQQSMASLNLLSTQFDESMENIEQASKALDRIKHEITVATHVAKELNTLLIVSLSILKMALA